MPPRNTTTTITPRQRRMNPILIICKKVARRGENDVPSRRRLLSKKIDTSKFKKDLNGNLVIPKGVKIAPNELFEIGYGPINVIDHRGANRDAVSVKVYNVTDEGPWFEDPEADEIKNNIVLIAVGIALLMAMIILGVVIGAYVQCKKKWDRRSQKIRELSKVREFYQGVLRPGQQEGSNSAGTASTNAGSETNSAKLPAFIKAQE